MRDRYVAIVEDGAPVCDELRVILGFIGQPTVSIQRERIEAQLNELPPLLALVVNTATLFSEFRDVLFQLQRRYPFVPLLALRHPQGYEGGQWFFDGIDVPFQQNQLLQVLHRCQASHAKKQPEPLLLGEELSSLAGSSPAIQSVRHAIAQVAAKDVNVLITGESGTGKEVVARELHKRSFRAQGPFVAINCGAIPSELLESELFGHEKGSFTGAVAARKGRFEIATGGTLFLDEIGDMPPLMQVKLLRVLQERCFERVGSCKSIPVDVRIIAATHRNLAHAINDGSFREDLYYRLNVFPIEMPSLHARGADLSILINELIIRIGKVQQCSLRFTDAAMECLRNYTWPGNVRELANFIERMMVLHPNDIVGDADLPSTYVAGKTTAPVANDFHSGFTGVQETLPSSGFDLREYLTHTEQAFIKQALDACDGVVAKAAIYLNMRRTTLIEKMRKYNIHRHAADLSELEDLI